MSQALNHFHNKGICSLLSLLFLAHPHCAVKSVPFHIVFCSCFTMKRAELMTEIMIQLINFHINSVGEWEMLFSSCCWKTNNRKTTKSILLLIIDIKKMWSSAVILSYVHAIAPLFWGLFSSWTKRFFSASSALHWSS